MGFSNSIDNALKKDRLVSFDELQRCQIHDQPTIQFGLEVKIKVCQHLQWLGQSAGLNQGLNASLLLGCSLLLHDIVNELVVSNGVFIGPINHLLVFFSQKLQPKQTAVIGELLLLLLCLILISVAHRCCFYF